MSSPPKLLPERPIRSADSAELPAPAGRTLLLCVLALILGAGLAFWLGRGASGTYVGYLHAQKMVVTASCNGTLGEIVADEGQFITVGAPLFLLQRDELAAQIAIARQEVGTLELALARAVAQANVDLVWRLKQVEEEILTTRLRSAELLQVRFDHELKQQALEAELRGETEPVLQPASLLKREGTSAKSGRVHALVEKETAANAVEVATVQLNLCESRLAELVELKDGLREQVRRAAGVEELELQLASAKDRAAQLVAQEQEFRIDAAVDGVVGVYRKRAGESVTAGEAIVEVLNEDERFVLVDVPSRRLGEFQDGADVIVGFPGGAERTGKVHRIPPQAILADRAASDAVAALRINPTGKLWPVLPIGSAVTVTAAAN